ncbi:MAG: serine/threonine-protein kinase [Bradymonadia bacterium]|jgi:serine/threonine-protein kinase
MASDLQIGLVFDRRYTIISRVGGGSFGVVYAAFDQRAGREVAVKILREKALKSPDLVARFEREGQICAALSSPHTARLHGFYLASATPIHPEMPYMVFDLVRGLPLGLILRERRMIRVSEAAHILVGVLDSLEEAHHAGIVHRDMKPDNVLCVPPAGSFVTPLAEGSVCDLLGVPPIDDNTWTDLTTSWVRVVDFGLGKLLAIGDRDVKPLTKAGMAAGTANYMAPEQLRAQSIDHRADIYGAGMLLHRLITGRETFHGHTIAAVAMAHINQPLPQLPSALEASPIAAVFRRAGCKNPAERYQTAAEMAHELRLVLDPSLAELPKPEFERPPEVRVDSGLSSVLKRMMGRK